MTVFSLEWIEKTPAITKSPTFENTGKWGVVCKVHRTDEISLLIPTPFKVSIGSICCFKPLREPPKNTSEITSNKFTTNLRPKKKDLISILLVCILDLRISFPVYVPPECQVFTYHKHNALSKKSLITYFYDYKVHHFSRDFRWHFNTKNIKVYIIFLSIIFKGSMISCNSNIYLNNIYFRWRNNTVNIL